MGQRHRAITLSDGTVIFDVLGAEGEDEEDDDDADEDEDEDEDSDPDGDEDEDENSDEDGDDAKDKGKKPSLKKLQADLAAAQAELAIKDRRMRRADRAKSKALNELNTLKTGGGKDLADARSEIERLQQELASKSGTDSKSLVRDEFLTSEKYTWQNRKAALKLLDLSEIDVEDGKVDKDSFEDAIDTLAKDYPFLLVPETKSTPKGGKDKDEDDEKDKPERPSGRQPNRNRPNNRKKTDTEALKNKFKVLQGRS